MARRWKFYAWIADTLDNRRITFPDDPDKAVWELVKKLSEANQQELLPYEARAVYVCKQVSGPRVDSEAIVKVKMQIPDTHYPHELWQERAKQASEVLNEDVEDEIEALKILTESGCSCTPRFMSSMREIQDNTMPVPGGYLVYILMEKLPGSPPYNIFRDEHFTFELRQKIRAAFRTALMEVRMHGIFPMDEGARNILWDEKSSKCYIVDFEHCMRVDDQEERIKGAEPSHYDYFKYGFIKKLGDGKEEW